LKGKVTVLYEFHFTDGATPEGGLVQGKDKSFYGTTTSGTNAFGTVFKIGASGNLNTIHQFTNSDGAFPLAAMVQASDSNFYGTTYKGGAAGHGTVFRISPRGKFTPLYSFCRGGGTCPDGAQVIAGLTLAADGNFYGVTQEGGSSVCSQGCGTIFRITRAGKLKTIYSFCTESGCNDGTYPEGNLIQGRDGSLYGTTLAGGTGTCVTFGGGCGTVFKVTPSGKLTTLHNFDDSDGAFPVGQLLQSNGTFYGTTYSGGSNTCSAGCGTVFRMTDQGKLTVIHSFMIDDGLSPLAGLLRATNGMFYGTTSAGGKQGNCDPNTRGCGTVFEVSP
jgi:uncharacterized repeat protein (TIGR03803 family)